MSFRRRLSDQTFSAVVSPPTGYAVLRIPAVAPVPHTQRGGAGLRLPNPGRCDGNASMTDADRHRLLHGPYRPPRYQIGGWLICEVRGRVQVKAMSAARIPWPMTHARPQRRLQQAHR